MSFLPNPFKIALLLLMGLILPYSPAMASQPAEISGTRKVMTVIRHVNIPRNDRAMLQNVQDILEFKGQLYSQEPLLTPTASLSKTVMRPKLEENRTLPAPYRSPGNL